MLVIWDQEKYSYKHVNLSTAPLTPPIQAYFGNQNSMKTRPNNGQMWFYRPDPKVMKGIGKGAGKNSAPQGA